jgi:hypothetical protein
MPEQQETDLARFLFGRKPCLERRQASLEVFDLDLLALDRPALFLDFIEKERGDQVIAHTLRPAVPVEGDQNRRDLGQFFGDQVVLRLPLVRRRSRIR